MNTRIASVDAYLANVTPGHRKLLKELRAIIKAAAPKSVEQIGYGMPYYKYHYPLVYFGSFANHCSFFPGDADTIAQFKTQLKGFQTFKGTIQFTPEKPLPASLVTRIVKLRVKQNEARKLMSKR